MLAAVYIVALVIYWVCRGALRRWAAAITQSDTVSLVPSALWPWEFLQCSRTGDEIRTHRLNVMRRRRTPLETVRVFDDQYRTLLETLPEYQAMLRIMVELYQLS